MTINEVEDIHYDDELDILEIYTGRDSYEASIEKGDLIFHLAGEGEIIGLEILNASNNLEGSKRELENVDKVKMESFRNGKDNIEVKITISSDKGEYSLENSGLNEKAIT